MSNSGISESSQEAEVGQEIKGVGTPKVCPCDPYQPTGSYLPVVPQLPKIDLLPAEGLNIQTRGWAKGRVGEDISHPNHRNDCKNLYIHWSKSLQYNYIEPIS